MCEFAGLAGLDRLRPEWETLCAAMGEADQPFWHPAWIRAHVEAFEQPQRLWILAARQQGRLAAVLPLIRERGWFRGLPVRRLRAAAGVYSVRFDAAALPGEAGAAAMRALAAHLCARRDWDLIELRDVPAGGAAELLLEDAAPRGHPTGRWLAMESPYLDLASPGAPSGLPPELRTASKNLRAQLSKGRRKLEAGGARLEVVRLAQWEGCQLREDLAQFYQVEGAGWKGRNRSSILARAGAREFYDLAAAAMAAEGSLVLHRLLVGDRVLAMSYGLRHHGCFYALKWSYDEGFAHCSPGHLLIEAMLREEAATPCEPLRRFDFTGANMPYKQKWAKTQLAHNYLFVFRRGWRGTRLHRLKFVWTPRLQRWAARIPRRSSATS